MFSGADGDRNYPTQWALNPSAYQNVSNDQVDWAALAQQWIMMKETCPPEQVPPAPPPPPIGPVKKDKENSTNAGSSLIEGGEAPMEVENEKDETEALIDPSIPPASWTGPATGPGSWGWQQQQWGWNTGWTAPPTVPGATPGAGVPPLALTKNALLPTPFGFPTADATASNYTGSRSNSYASGYWTSGQSGNRMKGNKKHRGGGGESDDEPESTTVTLDAAKRRQLPAWIREGLEKMEREKQKQLDKEREAREREEFLKRKKQEEEEVRKVMTDSGLVTLPSKSKFESDSEDSGKEDRTKPSFRRETPPKRIMKNRENTEMESPPIRSKSREERIQDVMLTVRRMMTEILLDVTTEEIENICQEELKRYRASASAMTTPKTPALASLTGKLGLGIYGESGSSGSESEHSDANDSDSNLKETIRRRKAEFMRTEREIDAHALDMERRLMEHERLQREHEQIGSNNSSGGGNASSSNNNAKDGDRYSQVDTANSHYGHSEKPTPRKSRFHDGPINENTQLPKTDDYTYAGGSSGTSGTNKPTNKNNTISNSNSKSTSRKRDKSSSSRSRTSSESKSDSSSESDSSGSRRHRHRSHRHHHGERNRRRSVSERRNSKRDSRSRSENSVDSRAGKVFKDPTTDSKKDRHNSKNGGNSEDRSTRYSSPEYSKSKSSRSKRSYSRERSTRSHRRSRSRDRRTKSRSRSRDRYSSRRSSSRDRRSKRRSSSRDRHRSSYDRRDRSRSRNRSRSYHRRSRSRSQHRGKKSSHRH